MKQKTMEALVEAGEGLAIDMAGREDYSGRGMFGKSTYAIVVNDNNQMFAAIALAASSLDENDLHEFVNDLKRIRTDSMGKGVIYY